MWNQLFQELQLSAMQMAMNVAHHLPGVAVLLAAILLALPIGLIGAKIAKYILTNLRFDEQLSNWGYHALITWSPERSPTKLVSRLIFWSVILVAFLIGLMALDASILSRISMTTLSYLPHLLAAVLILVVGAFFARHLAEGALISAVNMQLQSARLISLGVKWIILLISIAMALEHLGIGGSIIRLAFAILFGGVVLAMALAVGLGSKDLVSRNLQKKQENESGVSVDSLSHL